MRDNEYCPQCKADWRCPCGSEHCAYRRKEGDPVWEYAGLNIRCCTCGFSQRHEWWLDYDFHLLNPKKYRMPEIQNDPHL